MTTTTPLLIDERRSSRRLSRVQATREMAHGYIVIPARGLTRGQRDNLYRAGTLQSSSKAFHGRKGGAQRRSGCKAGEGDPAGEVSDGMRSIREYTIGLGKRLLDKEIHVRFVHCDRFGEGKRWAACYGRGGIPLGFFDYNVRTRPKVVRSGACEALDDLILHERGHEFESTHLCEGYHAGP